MKSLSEQLEQEKKAASDAKSLKTEQISTLTSKLANAVRQREQAEEELAKVNKEMEELKEELKLQAEEREAKEKEDGTDSHKKEDESSKHQCVEGPDEAVNTQDYIKAKDIYTASSCLANDESIENGMVSLQLEDECDALPIGYSLHENSPTDELSQSATNTELSLSLSSALSDDSFTDKNGDLFLLEVSQSSSSEIYDSNHINHSFKSHEENLEEKEEARERFVQIEKDLCEEQKNMFHDLGEDVTSVTEERQKILEAAKPTSAGKNRRICAENSEEDQESSPPSSPKAVPSGYTSNSTDENLVNLLMCHGMGDGHGAAKFPRNEDKEQDMRPTSFLNEYASDDVTRETTKVEEHKALENLITREEVVESVLHTNYKALEERCFSFKTTGAVNEAEKGDRKRSELQNDFLPLTMSEEFWDLKRQLKNALKEIEELRSENKEMKRKIQNLSFSGTEEEFLLKTTKFTDRLLKEMKEREAKMYVPTGVSYLEKYGLDRDYSNPGSTDLSQMRSAGDMNRSVGKKTSLPVKIIGAKLKELKKSVENMATDPELCQEDFSNVCVPDFRTYKHRHSSLNGQFGLEESLIMTSPCSETISQSTALPQFNPSEKFGEKCFLASSKIQPQLLEEACAWKENNFQLTDRETEERSDYDSQRHKWRLHSDTRDYVQRYVVRSSDHIAKMRDLTPEEVAFYSKLG